MTSTPSDASMYAAVRAAVASLTDAGVGAPEVDAVELAAHVLGIDGSEVRRRMVMRDPADEAFHQRYRSLIDERASRVPLQHLTGRAHFRNLTLDVGPGVFVPRPETESVAGWAIDATRAALAAALRRSTCCPSGTYCAVAGCAPVVVDLCTGSGAIALAIKDEVPQARVHAIELSQEAHAWAQQNVARTGLDVDLRQGDAITSFGEFEGQVDVVVSNPPYIPTGAVPVDPEVRDHDPGIALYGGSEDGLAIPRLVAARGAYLLRPGGVLVMEHADSQGESLPAALSRTDNWSNIEDRDDLNGRPRAIVAVRA